MNNTEYVACVDPGFSLCWFPRNFPVLALHPCLWSSSYAPCSLANTVMYFTVTYERYNSRHVCPLGRSFEAERTSARRSCNNWTNNPLWRNKHKREIYKLTSQSDLSPTVSSLFFPIFLSFFLQKKRHVECSSGVDTLFFLKKTKTLDLPWLWLFYISLSLAE